MQISDERLRGRTVIGADGRAIGEVVGLIVDSEGWQLAALQVRLRRAISESIGLKKGVFSGATVDVPRQALQSVGDAVILSISLDSLREIAGRGRTDEQRPDAKHPAPVH